MKRPGLDPRRRFARAISTFLSLCIASCAVTPPAPVPDLDAPGWVVRTGQALWHPAKEARPISGDIVIARRDDGSAWIDFSKSAVPVFQGQIAEDRWWISFVAQDKHWSGRGRPPARFVWFTVIDAVFDRDLPADWQVSKSGADLWTFKNTASREHVKLVLDP